MTRLTASWLKFNTVGLLGIGVQLPALALLKGAAGLATVPATAIAVEAAVLHNFVWHECWTWKHRRLESGGTLARFLRFNAGNGLISIAGNVALMWLLESKLQIHYLISIAVAIAICSTVNFMVSDRLVFSERDRVSPPARSRKILAGPIPRRRRSASPGRTEWNGSDRSTHIQR
jgi:putative flippase GtrA